MQLNHKTSGFFFVILLNEIKEKKTLKKEVKDTQLNDITKQSEDIDEINRGMCISSSSIQQEQ